MRGATRLSVGGAFVDGTIVPGDVEVVDGRVARVGLASTGSGLAAPGFVDLQVNGFGGVDFLDASASDLAVAGEAMVQTGVTACQPTYISAPEATVVGALGELVAAGPHPGGPRILGAHLEGPFLSPARSGTHPVADLRDPDPDLLDRLLHAGPVRTVTLAPELPGAEQLVRHLVARDVVVWAGHSDADAAAANAGFDLGIRAVTHLFNAMRPFSHRDPGLPGVALARPDVAVGLIVDGVHLAPDTVRLAMAAAADRAVLVTDAISAAGRGDGTWRLGSVEVEVEGSEARRADGTLAGSVLTMDRAVRLLVEGGTPEVVAIAAATATPARLVGRPELGTLRPGTPADVVILDDDLTVRRVLCDGQDAW